ncbi:MAG TPA: leucyl aminopeptidase [Bacteroidota bacterium]|nr:leucyl aminopeptidase [Bacteroidota bacterium]
MVKLSYAVSSPRRAKADAVAFFVAQDKGEFNSQMQRLRKIFGRRLDTIIGLDEFKGKAGEVCSFLTEKKLAAPRCFLVGLGETKKHTLETYRRAAAAAAKKAQALNGKTLVIALPESGSEGFTDANVAKAAAEGAALSLYRYDKYFTEDPRKNKKLREVILTQERGEHAGAIKSALNEARILCEATCLARDLENAPGNELYPETLADAARASAGKYGYRAAIWDKKKIEQMKFGGLLAVNSGSDRPPRFIILEHNAGRKDMETIVFVGKGITFDAGGISIKPASGMSEMKMDMSGSAAVIGALEAASRLKLPFHVVGLIASTENLLGGSAMRPGDIITHYGGKTSEVDNTDAEGRLVLADALGYASTFNPKVVIDLATLTGACVVALGSHATGMMGNDEEVMAVLKAAGETTFERVWPLPLYEEYENQIKSDVADVKNVGGRWAGAITAGLFLKKFIGEYRWVHLDIAGTAILEESLPYAHKGGSGVGVRLLIEFLKNWKS